MYYVTVRRYRGRTRLYWAAEKGWVRFEDGDARSFWSYHDALAKLEELRKLYGNAEWRWWQLQYR